MPESLTPLTENDAALAVDTAWAVLRRGGVVAYPSETVWGLAAVPDHPEAVERLYVVKGRAAHRPVQVSCQDARAALELARPSAALTALSVLWPGPLTLVTPALSGTPPTLAPGGLVGLRVPSHPLALALLRRCGGRLLTTSCNPSGLPPALTAAQARDMALADFVLPDVQAAEGEPMGGQASTVVQLPEGTVLRSGLLDGAVAALLAGLRE
ncbi:L-threonylcarbamoyladenylate synthase [Deinococcus marmoris]|uniref:L-threonylcarbamoyladenylate synthase n=1 Tax=Deinococcus marmoris TaxID=249408 RepID=A0A1U7NYH1_9DEIO|nr:L-threonylcarbamoyladenylate synthase [Deinococcus marmoris]OLV17966.1 TsaC protein (YrdC domain) required for threonylcarbamoyladenosine t(6)A37 modification in tRNA [Deinococcus marmoris]